MDRVLAAFCSKCRILVTRPFATVRFPSRMPELHPHGDLADVVLGAEELELGRHRVARIDLLHADVGVLGVPILAVIIELRAVA